MFVITKDETRTLTSRLQSLGANNLVLLYLSVLGEDASHTLTQPVLATVAQLALRIAPSAGVVIETCDWLVQTFPAAPENPNLKAIVDRLRAEAARQAILQAANPVDEIWIGAEPMVNRIDLRNILRELCDLNYDHRVIYVAGNAASGRKHSKHLIRHLAERKGIRFHSADFFIETEARTLPHLFDQLRSAYQLGPIDLPPYLGSTPGDVAFRFATRLIRRLNAAPAQNPIPWVVIDFTWEVVDPAIAEFIRILCIERLKDNFNNCVIFILGPTAHLETLRGEPSLQIEVLSSLTPSEIQTAAFAINQRGHKPLDAADLGIRVTAIIESVGLMQEDQRNAEIRNHLLGLRQEVSAP